LLLAATTDSETAERGYVITADESYLEPYERSIQLIDTQTKRLRVLIADNRTQQQRLGTAAQLVSERVANVRRVINLRRDSGFEAAQREILTGQGKRSHDQLRRIIDEMKSAESGLLVDRERLAARSAAIAQTVILTGGLLTCALVALSVLAIRRDFAGRAHAERALRQSTEELELRVRQRTAQLALSHEHIRAIVDTALDGIVTMDHEGRLTEFNPAAEGIFGYRRSEVVGQPLADIIIPAAWRERHREGLARYLASGEAAVLGKRIEVMGLRADGSEVMVEVSINRLPGDGPPSFGGFIRDITVRKTAEEMNARLAAIVKSSDDAIVSKTLEGIITSWNPGAETLFGYSAQEAVGKPMMMLFPPERSAEEPMILARITRGEATDHFETVRVGKDGRKINVSVTISPIRDGQGRIIGASTIARDTTERKLAEQKIQAQLGRLDLLQQITRAMGERQDIQSIFQVTIRTLEEQLPLDFCCMCIHDPVANQLIVTSVGSYSEPLAMALAMTKQALIDIDENGLSQCVRGYLVYEPHLEVVRSPFPQRLSAGGLQSMVAAPLLVESQVFGILIAARHQESSFSSGECEFLKQLSEHVALAAHQAQLYRSLQQAYDDLRQHRNPSCSRNDCLPLGRWRAESRTISTTRSRLWPFTPNRSWRGSRV